MKFNEKVEEILTTMCEVKFAGDYDVDDMFDLMQNVLDMFGVDYVFSPDEELEFDRYEEADDLIQRHKAVVVGGTKAEAKKVEKYVNKYVKKNNIENIEANYYSNFFVPGDHVVEIG
jgi:hypothetical protein